MKATELIEALNRAVAESGDLIVCLPGMDGAGWNNVQGRLQAQGVRETPGSIVHDYDDAVPGYDNIEVFTLW